MSLKNLMILQQKEANARIDLLTKKFNLGPTPQPETARKESILPKEVV